MDNFYPVLDAEAIKSINTIIMLYESNTSFFEGSPYPQRVIDLFKGRLKHHDFDRPEVGNELPSDDNVIAQINRLSKDLSDYGREVQTGDASASDKNTYFRLATTLLEKLVDLKERAVNVKEYSMFITVVLDAIDRELDTDQRNQFLRAIEINLNQPLTVGSKDSTKEDNNNMGNNNDTISTTPTSI